MSNKKDRSFYRDPVLPHLRRDIRNTLLEFPVTTAVIMLCDSTVNVRTLKKMAKRKINSGTLPKRRRRVRGI